MDQFIEASGLWAGFHDSLITYLRESLQPVLPRGYYAEIRMREEVGVAGFQSERVIFPDVAVSQKESHPDGPTASDQLSIEAPQPELLTIAEEPSVNVNFLEIRDLSFRAISTSSNSAAMERVLSSARSGRNPMRKVRWR